MSAGRPKGHSKKELYKLAVARSDITAALEISNLVLREVKSLGDDLYYPLLNALIVCYSRPFSPNKPLGSLKKKWHKFNNPDFQEIHEEILELRDKVVAHSDLEVRRVHIYPRGTPLPELGKGMKSGGSLSVSSYYLPLEMFPVIRDACFDLGTRLNNEVERALSLLLASQDYPPEHVELTFDDEIG